MKVYFLKNNLEQYQIFPIPTDLNDFIEIEVESESILESKQLVKNGNEYMLVDKKPNDFYKWKNNKWVIDKAKQKEQLNAEKTRLVLFTANKVDEMKSALLSGYPQAEIDSFYKQEKEALAYKEDKNAETPMLKIIAQTRGVPFELLVEKVLEKSSQFSHAMGAIIGQRQKFEDRILATESIEDLTVIENEVKEWQFNLES
ncbi:hypothetical protein QQW93_06410 [Pasteurella multocida]|uniref:hypothetical protein n=1 Tax=Pasteurella multocida TaxID=747 RepID=UPI002A525FA3|nr:hypothetical protein [Pasteurella multocida]MDY0489657.1 hypothetical protein [Pasteurella multocida]MDY0669924.1 hypothetical protein [Pasteurella multocida]MDY0690410.1 hypothetical protein [Pasteurella multocida]MDY0721526.1 hypothetical protein [Pasteurella multocida]MEB4493949.1 hypothetical protein [Pasteurella multocida]